MGSAAGQLRSRNGFVVIWDPHALAEMLACRAMFEVSPEDELFPAAALGARPQPPRDWGQRKPPPRREPAERRRRSSQPHQPPLPGIDAPRRPQRPEEPREAGRPAEWALREPPGRLRAARAPRGDAPGERNVRLFDAVRHFAYPLPRGRGGPAMYAQWGRFIQDYAAACNGEFAVPLSDGDVAKTARSVARFCWANPSFGKPVDPGRRDRGRTAAAVPSGGAGAAAAGGGAEPDHTGDARWGAGGAGDRAGDGAERVAGEPGVA